MFSRFHAMCWGWLTANPPCLPCSRYATGGYKLLEDCGYHFRRQVHEFHCSGGEPIEFRISSSCVENTAMKTALSDTASFLARPQTHLCFRLLKGSSDCLGKRFFVGSPAYRVEESAIARLISRGALLKSYICAGPSMGRLLHIMRVKTRSVGRTRAKARARMFICGDHGVNRDRLSGKGRITTS